MADDGPHRRVNQNDSSATLTSDYHGRANATQTAEAAANAGTAASPWLNYAPTEWDNATTVAYLEVMRVPEAGIAEAINISISGCQLVAVIEDADCHELLQDSLHMTGKMARIQLVASLKQHVSLWQGQATPPKVDTQALGSESTRPTILAGERAMKLPSLPKSQAGSDFCSPTDYKLFMQDTIDWGNLQEEQFGRVVQEIYNDPTATDVDDRLHNMSDLSRRMDKVLGVHLRTEMSTEVKRMMVDERDYQFQQVTSALKIMAYFGRKINKKCQSRFLTLTNTLTSRKPLTHPAELKSELTEITNLMQDITHQGQPVADEMFYSILHRAVSKLIMDPTMNLALTLPVCKCIDSHGVSGRHLLECLQEADYELRHNALYKPLMVPKQVAPVGGVRPGYNTPKYHTQQRSGADCLNERDLGECLMHKEGKCQGKHKVSKWTHKDCTNPVYQKHGV